MRAVGPAGTSRGANRLLSSHRFGTGSTICYLVVLACTVLLGLNALELWYITGQDPGLTYTLLAALSQAVIWGGAILQDRAFRGAGERILWSRGPPFVRTRTLILALFALFTWSFFVLLREFCEHVLLAI